MAISKEWMDELKAKCDIASVVSRYVALERKGRLLWGRCPFHGEKTPSFAVNEYDGFYHCFGCHAGGDVIKFIREIESVDFMEALKILADFARMEMPEDNYDASTAEYIRENKKKQEKLKALMKDTAKFYHKNLYLPEAQKMRDYLNHRKMDNNVIKRFGLGASVDANSLITYLSQLDYSLSDMIDAGVVKVRDDKPYDALSGRVIFPIINNYGEVVAFGGRTLDPKPNFAKYLNTAETLIFSKSKNLYAINLIRKQKTEAPIDYLIVVEGYADVISLHKAGFTTAVASMGTALTIEQARLIKRYANKVYICYDGDSAGKNATLRGLEILRDHGLDVFIVSLPDPLDPDDVINKYGAEGYQKLLDNALPLLEFKLKYLATEFDMSSLDGKTKYAEKAIIELNKTKEVEREMYTSLVAQTAGLNIDFIRRMMKGEGISEVNEKNQPVQNEKLLPNTCFNRSVLPSDSALIKAEKQVLSSVLHKKNYAYPTKNYSYLFTGNRVKFFEFLFEHRDLEASSLVPLFYNAFSEMENEEAREEASEIISYTFSSGDEANENAYYKDCLFLLYKRYLEALVAEKNNQLKSVVETDKRREIMLEINELIRKIKSKKVDL